MPIEIQISSPARQSSIDPKDVELHAWLQRLRDYPELMLHATGAVAANERVPRAAQAALRRRRVQALLTVVRAAGLGERIDAREPEEISQLRADLEPAQAAAKLDFAGVFLYANHAKPPPPNPAEDCLPGVLAELRLSREEVAAALQHGPTLTFSLCAEQRCSSVELSPATLSRGRRMAVSMHGELWTGAFISADEQGLVVQLRSMNKHDAPLREGERFQALIWQGTRVVRSVQAGAHYVPVFHAHVGTECALFRFGDVQNSAVKL